MGHPGTLPTVNAYAIEQVLRVGKALGGTLADYTEFDRKNYFYPDIPKGYQISQYKHPLVSGGVLGGVSITRIHLEEDTARSAHTTDASLIDFNRAGVPLLELVTEPVIHSSETAISFARDFRLCLRYLNVSNANLEKGEMRVEANISLATEGAEVFGTKVEVKNLNSFRALGSAIEYEIRRQREVIQSGAQVRQETRGWDESKQKTVAQRLKEDSHDYRYYPDPDIPKFKMSDISLIQTNLREELHTALPWDVRAKYVSMGLSEHVVELLVSNDEIRTFYEEVHQLLEDEKSRLLCINYITTDLWSHFSGVQEGGAALLQLDRAMFAKLINMIANGTLSSRGAKIVLEEWVKNSDDPAVIAERLQVVQVSDDTQVDKIVETILSDQQTVTEEYLAGKEQAFEFLVGHGMRITRGSVNPELLRKKLKNVLESRR